MGEQSTEGTIVPVCTTGNTSTIIGMPYVIAVSLFRCVMPYHDMRIVPSRQEPNIGTYPKVTRIYIQYYSTTNF